MGCYLLFSDRSSALLSRGKLISPSSLTSRLIDVIKIGMLPVPQRPWTELLWKRNEERKVALYMPVAVGFVTNHLSRLEAIT
jgi:hypothetical protein